MKIIALLLMLLGVALIAGVGVMSLLAFAMGFDAPGSADKPGVWLLNSLIFLPSIGLMVVLVLAFNAYRSGQYGRSVGFGSVFALLAGGGALYFSKTSYDALRDYRAREAEAAENARLYPLQKFVRSFEGGADTILVFPDRIVAYRLAKRGDLPFPYSGPVGDLNEARDAILISRSYDWRIGLAEFPEFVDENGRKLTEVYSIR